MGPIIEWPTFDSWLYEIQSLLYLVGNWLLTSGFGPTILITMLVMIVLWAVAVIHGNVKVDDSIFRDDYRR